MTGERTSTAGAVSRIVVPYRVRFDESTPGGTLRTSACLRYIQDVAWVHSVRLGFGRDWYAERGLWWLVRVVDLDLLLPIEAYVELAVSTEVTGWRRISARRESDVVDPAGRIAARAAIDWVITNERGMPTRVPAELAALFPTASDSFTPNRLELPPTPVDALQVETIVRPQDLDPMGHVNNTVYVDYLEEALSAAGEHEVLGGVPRHYRLEYLRPAPPGARLVGALWRDGRTWAYRLSDAGGTELLRAEFRSGDPA